MMFSGWISAWFNEDQVRQGYETAKGFGKAPVLQQYSFEDYLQAKGKSKGADAKIAVSLVGEDKSGFSWQIKKETYLRGASCTCGKNTLLETDRDVYLTPKSWQIEKSFVTQTQPPLKQTLVSDLSYDPRTRMMTHSHMSASQLKQPPVFECLLPSLLFSIARRKDNDLPSAVSIIQDSEVLQQDCRITPCGESQAKGITASAFALTGHGRTPWYYLRNSSGVVFFIVTGMQYSRVLSHIE